MKCTKCNKGKVTARFMGKDICEACYDKAIALIRGIARP